MTPPCHVSIQRMHAYWKYPLELDFIKAWSATYLGDCHLLAGQHRPVHHADVVYRDNIAQSHESCDHYYDATHIFGVKQIFIAPQQCIFHSDNDRCYSRG